MQLRLKLNQRPETDGSNWTIPKIDFGIDLERLVLCLVRHQYKDALQFIEALDRFRVSARYLKFRPQLNVYRGHYREWQNLSL
jgi:vacuolar protein sorting-associated protein 13A/C